MTRIPFAALVCFAIGCASTPSAPQTQAPSSGAASRAEPNASNLPGPKSAAQPDVQAILEVVQVYIKSGRAGESKTMRGAFFDNATIFSIEEGELKGGPIEQLFVGVDQLGAAPGLTERVGPVDLSGNTATVRIDIDDWAGARYTDQLTLMKVHGEWKILHKVYRHHTH